MPVTRDGMAPLPIPLPSACLPVGRGRGEGEGALESWKVIIILIVRKGI
jgi:hypothetical protein